MRSEIFPALAGRGLRLKVFEIGEVIQALAKGAKLGE
jgi:hypothetical protein